MPLMFQGVFYGCETLIKNQVLIRCNLI